MRPGHGVVLLTHSHAKHLQLSLVLRVWRYEVADEYHRMPRAVVVEGRGPRALQRLVKLHAPVPVIALVHSDEERKAAALAGVYRVAADHTDLRFYLRQGCMQKRGPKPNKELAA